MGVWDGLSPTDYYLCEIPDCEERAVTAFLPAFESPGGWTGDNHEYASTLEIAYVCKEHKPDRLKEHPVEKRYLITESQLRAVNDALFDASSFYDTFDDDNEGRGELIRKAEAATENLEPEDELPWTTPC